MGIKQIFNDIVTLGLALTRQIDVAAREDLRTNFSGKKEYREGIAHTSFLERAREGRKAGTKAGQAFKKAVELGKIAIRELNTPAVAPEGMRLKNGGTGFERNPTDDSVHRSYSQRVREAVKNPKPSK